MAFQISFVDRESPGRIANAELVQPGRLVVGDFEEGFEASISFWSVRDYERSWLVSLERILERASTSCLITSIYDPANANFLVWWPLYRQGAVVYVQNQILFLHDIRGQFDLTNPYGHILKRQVVNKDGSPISEWTTSIQDIQQWVSANLALLE